MAAQLIAEVEIELAVDAASRRGPRRPNGLAEGAVGVDRRGMSLQSDTALRRSVVPRARPRLPSLLEFDVGRGGQALFERRPQDEGADADARRGEGIVFGRHVLALDRGGALGAVVNLLPVGAVDRRRRGARPAPHRAGRRQRPSWRGR